MWLKTPINLFDITGEISNFGYYSNIDRFDIIVDMANSMKSCHLFRVDHLDRKLYGCGEEPYCLHSLPLPPTINYNKSFSFRFDTLDLEMIKRYRNFVIPTSAEWCLIPTENIPYSESYIQYYKDKVWIIVDKNTGQKADFIDLYGVDTDKAIYIPYIDKLVANKKESDKRLFKIPSVFEHAEQYPQVQTVMSSKVSIGALYLSLTSPTTNKSYGMMIFKNLFNLNKNDQLDIIIQDRVDSPSIFQTTFLVKRKKNPIQYIMHPYVEEISSLFVNM